MLFSIFIDDLIHKVITTKVSCYKSSSCDGIFLFADDILLLSPTITGLQSLFNFCERELEGFDMRVSAAKSMCIGFGHRFDAQCVELTFIHGGSLKWVSKCRYLGVFSQAVEHSNALLTMLNLNLSEPSTLYIVRLEARLLKKLFLLY